MKKNKKDILAASQAEVDDIEHQYRDGIITRTEKYNKDCCACWVCAALPLDIWWATCCWRQWSGCR